MAFILMPDLVTYLRSQAMRPFAWGTADCGTLIADWVRERRGIDPLASVRGNYAGADDGVARVADWGGLARAVGRCLRGAGLAMTKVPAPGDVAVVVFGGHLCCAIRTARGWAMRLDGGMALIPADRARLVAAWRV